MKLQGGALPRPWSVGQGVGDVGPSISEAGQASAAWQAAHSAQVCICSGCTCMLGAQGAGRMFVMLLAARMRASWSLTVCGHTLTCLWEAVRVAYQGPA